MNTQGRRLFAIIRDILLNLSTFPSPNLIKSLANTTLFSKYLITSSILNGLVGTLGDYYTKFLKACIFKFPSRLKYPFKLNRLLSVK